MGLFILYLCAIFQTAKAKVAGDRIGSAQRPDAGVEGSYCFPPPIMSRLWSLIQLDKRH